MKNRNLTFKPVLILLAIAFWSQSLFAQNLINNSSFTSGWDWWGRIHEGGSEQLTVNGSINYEPTPIPAPTLGGNTFSYFGTQSGPSRNILYQSFTAPYTGLIIAFDIYVNNTSPDGFVTQSHLEYEGDANQQTRVDLITQNANIYSVSSGDVISMVYRTETGYSNVFGWNRVSVTIPASTMQYYYGNAVKLRIAQVDNLGCFGLGITNVLVQAVAPPNPTSVSASSNPICRGTSTQLTANGAVGTVYWYTGSCGGSFLTTGNPINVSPTSTTTYYARNYNNSAFSAGCASGQVTVEQTAVSGTLSKSPNVTTICEGTNVAANLTSGSGGNGTDVLEYQTKTGAIWSGWSVYTSAASIGTTGKSGIQVRTRRMASYCSPSEYVIVEWIVEPTPYSGSLVKSLDVTNVCEGTSVSATFTPGSGGNGTDVLEYQTKTGPTWSGWSVYTSSASIGTTGKSGIQVRTRRMASYCSPAEYVIVEWTVEPTPYSGSLVKSLDVTNVCEGANVSAALTAGSGGNGTDVLEYQTKTGTTWSGWSVYISETSIPTTGKSGVQVRTRRMASYCSPAEYVIVEWTVEPTPYSGSLVKSLDVTNVCEGTSVSATFTPGSGGNGTDVLEYQTKTGPAWSGWSAYTSEASIATTGKSGVEIRTWRVADYCDDAATVTVSWVVDPTTVGGAVTGGAIVCYGSHSTMLTLSGHTGSVVNWQSSTNGTDWTDFTNILSTYTAENLTVDTWFRAVVKSGECLVETSGATLITMFTDYHISGYAKYYNNPKTPLDGLKITLKKGGIVQGTPVYTGTNGYFNFGGLVNGTYDIEVSTANPSGQWQTWNGCNNTDYLLVYRHAMTIAPLAVDPPVVRVSGSVVAPHPGITIPDANAVRNAAKYGWFMPGTTTPWFDIPKWVFSGTTTLTPISGFGLNCSNVTRDIYGLCAGDVNGSYLPTNGYKTGVGTFHGMSVQLVNRGTLPITQEIIFPVRAEQDMELGAITLMLDYDPALIEITGVEMPDGGEDLPYFIARDGVLHIGWMSLDPVSVTQGETLLLIRGKMINGAVETGLKPVSTDAVIRFTLNQNPLCELADADGNVINGAKLAIANAGSGLQVAGADMLSVYPNPVSDILNIEFLMEKEGSFMAELMSLTGVLIAKINRNYCIAGLNKATMNLGNIPNGAYLLRVAHGEGYQTTKVIVNR